jgi:TRAP-type C4-dicarboxylate transport system permease small subunit
MLASRLFAAWDRLLSTMFLVASALIFVLMALICLDVILRNVPVIPGVHGISWANEVSEATLYLSAMLASPWLLSQGRHIRVDIFLRALPDRVGWSLELVADVLGFVCCVVLAVYGVVTTYASYAAGAVTIRTLVTPEYWLLLPLPIVFLLLSVEVLFRLRRLYIGPRVIRDDAISSD